MAAVMGVGVTFLTLYYMANGLNPIAGVIVILAVLAAAVIMGVAAAALGFAGRFSDRIPFSEDEERLKVLRASHQALLEEMDDEIAILKQIRDNLKSPGEGHP